VAEIVTHAITVWQPWASLIAIGAKPYEFRSWRPPSSIVGQRIAIHAGARPVQRLEVRALIYALRTDGSRVQQPCLHRDIALPLLERIQDALRTSPDTPVVPLSHIVCTAVVGEPRPGDEIAQEFGAGNDSDREGTFNWGWPMLAVEICTPPTPARGRQGLWRL
jgi:hypothetical protein